MHTFSVGSIGIVIYIVFKTTTTLRSEDFGLSYNRVIVRKGSPKSALDLFVLISITYKYFGNVHSIGVGEKTREGNQNYLEKLSFHHK